MVPVVSAWVATLKDLFMHTEDENNAMESLDGDGVSVCPEPLVTGWSNDLTGVKRRCSAQRNSHTIPVAHMPDDLDERHRLSGIFSQYEVCRNELTAAQWKAVCLSFRDGHTQLEIADRLGKSRSAIHGLLKRAGDRKDAFQRRLRSEKYNLARKYLNSSE